MKTAKVILALLVMLSAGAYTTAAEPDVLPVYMSKAYARGDFDKVAVEWADFIKKHPDSPETELLLSNISRLYNYCTNFEIFARTFEDVLGTGVSNGTNARYMRSRLKSFYKEKGLDEEAEKLGVTDGWINDFAVIGPFDPHSAGEALYEMIFPPETEIDFSAEYTRPGDKKKKVRWHTIPYTKPRSGVYIRKFMRPSYGGCAYAVAQCSFPEETDALLLVEMSGAYKIWVNERLVKGIVRRNTKWTPSTFFLPVHLAKGWNRILVKRPSSGYVSVRLVDRMARPLENVTWEKELALHEIGEGAGINPVIKPLTGALDHFRKRAETEPDNARALLALAYFARQEGLAAEELESMEKALELAPEDPFVNYYIGKMYESSRLVPDNKRKPKAKQAYKSVLKADKEFALAYEELADFLDNDDKPKEAIKELDKILKFNPKFFHAHYLAIGFLSRRSWTADAVDRWKKIEKIYPDWIKITSFWAGYYAGLGNDKKALELREKIYERDKEYTHVLRLRAQKYLEKGEDEKALAIYRKLHKDDPDSDWYTNKLISYHKSRENWKEAIKLYEKLALKYPEDREYLNSLGKLYQWSGNVEKAVEYYRKVLKMHPAEITMHRYLQFLAQEDENFAKPYLTSEEELEELIKNTGSASDFPKSSTVTILDEKVQLVYADGSSSSYIRNVYKVLNQRGVDAHLSEYASGEILEVKVTQPSGEVFEPIGMGGSFTLHGLTIGSVVETYSRKDSSYPSEFSLNAPDSFYLQDPGQPNRKISRVVIVDQRLEMMPPQERNFKAGEGPLEGDTVDNIKVSASQTPDGIYNVYKWEALDMPRIEPERYMPSRSEYLPRVFFIRKHEWDDFTPGFVDGYYSYDIRPTKLIREKTAEVIKDVEGQSAQAKAIYEYGMEQVRRPGWGGNAHVALVSRNGSREALFRAMLNIAGIEWDIARITRDPKLMGPIEWQFPNPGIFSSTVMRVRPDDGPDIWVESFRIKRRPFGKISEYYQGGIAFIIRKDSVSIERIPRENDEGRADSILTAEIDLDTLTGNAAQTLPAARHYRNKQEYEEMQKTYQKNAISAKVNDLFPGASLKEFNFPDLKSSETPFKVCWSMDVPNFIVQTRDEGVLCKLGIKPLEMQEDYISESTRKYPLVARVYYTYRDTIKINLGKKYRLAKLPPGLVRIGEFGVYLLSIKESDGVITVSRSYNFNPLVVQPKDYPRFIDFCRSIDDAESMRIVLEEK